MENVTRSLAGFTANAQYEALEKALVLHFKKHLLDAIGCGLHGASHSAAAPIFGFAVC